MDFAKLAAAMPPGSRALLLAAKPHPNAPAAGPQVDWNAPPASLRYLRSVWLLKPRPSKLLTPLGCQAQDYLLAASVDTRPQGGDCLQAPLESGAVGEAEYHWLRLGELPRLAEDMGFQLGSYRDLAG
jgi:hypothetical protein